MPPLRGCHATAQIHQRFCALVFIIRVLKLCVAKKLVLPELTKMIGVKVQVVIWVRITDDKGAEPVEGTCVFILFICSCIKSGV